jgi:hypothetical protein
MKVKYAPTLASAGDTSRGPSPAIWNAINTADFDVDPSSGQHVFDDFQVMGTPGSTAGGALAASAGKWNTYAYTGSTITDGGLEGGVIVLQSDGDQEGVCLMSQAGSFRLVTTSTLALNKKLCFEARVSRSSVADDKGDFFVGLCTPSLSSGLPAAAIPISTTDATMSTTPSFLGFHSVDKAGVTYGDPRDWSLVFNLASGTVNAVTNLTTCVYTATGAYMAGADYFKLGFIFDPQAYEGLVTSATARQTAGWKRRKLLRVFVNGIELPAFLSAEDVANATAGQAFPTAFMAPCIAMMNTTASSPPTMGVDWIRVGQEANS